MIRPFNPPSFEEEKDKIEEEAKVQIEFRLFFDRPAEQGSPPEEDKEKDEQKEDIDLEAIAKKAFEDAYRQGEKAGIEMGMKKLEPVITRLNNYITILEDFKKELADKAERLAVELAFIMAEAIILKEVKEDKGVILRMARRAMELCEGRGEITIRVRRDDLAYIAEHTKGIFKTIADDSLKEPGFIIETTFGDIDGRLSTQLEELKKEFIGENGNGYKS